MADMPEFNAKLWSQNLSAVLDRNRDMAACRKLKQDIEQTLKKVADGILLFNEFNKKMEESQNVKDRDKAMMEMKRELKKLQRIREQIRTWANDATIRDTSLLIEARRAIEHQMEHFKECEKEAKLKPFAKAALAAKNERIDPVAHAKEEAQRWLRDSVNSLAEQVEGFEADVEVTPGKSRDLEPLIANHKTHIGRLEQVMRLLENDQVEPNDLGNLKDSMEHYLQDAAEPDFVEDTLMYENLPLGEVDSRVGHIAKHEKAKNADGTDQEPEDSEDEESAAPGGERSSAKQARAGDHRGSKRRKDSGSSAKKRPSKSKALPFAQGIVVTGSSARQAGASPTAQQSQGKAARAAPESAKAAAPAQQRAVALPKPLVSDQLQSLQTSPDAGYLEDTLQEDGSSPSRAYERYSSDLESTLAEPLQGFDSFSLPPGLYAPEVPATFGAQAPNQTQPPFLDQLQTQGSNFTVANESPLYPVTQASAVSESTQYTGSMDAQYFQTAQMKLHAREQRLQLERAMQQSAVQQQQAMQMQLQLQLLQQQQPPPPPRTSPFESQSALAPSPLPAVQTQGGRDVPDVGSDGGGTPMHMPPSPCVLPTVDEEGSQELPAELPDDIILQKKAGQGQERKESRRRRGGRGKRNNVNDDSLEASHRKPPSPKLADLIMPALKAREKAQSEALEKQRGGSVQQEGGPASEAGESATEAADGAAEASAAAQATPGETRSFADVAKPAQLLRPWAQVAQDPPPKGQGQGQGQGSQAAGKQREGQTTPVSVGHQSLFTQQPGASSPVISHDDTHFPPLPPSFNPWLRRAVPPQPSPEPSPRVEAPQAPTPQPPAPAEGLQTDGATRLTAEQYQQLLHLQQQQQQQQEQQLQLQAQLQQAAQAAAMPMPTQQWSAQTQHPLQQKLALSRDFQTHPFDQGLSKPKTPETAQPEGASATAGPWSIKADWQPFSHQWHSDLRAALPYPGCGQVNPERAGERPRPAPLNLWGEREEYRTPSVPEPRQASPSIRAAVDSGLKYRPDAVDQDYSTTHLNQAHGKFCSLRHLAEPLHADVSGRAAAECFNVRPGLIPHLFDKPEFFDKIAERSQLTGQSPDLLFFAFYYQPISVTLTQGTLQQRYAAAALQKLNWYYLPQTKRWYKPINTGTTVDNFGRVHVDQGACMYFHQDLKRTGINDWEGWSIKHTTNSFGQGRAHHPSFP